jgi:hypothetical protein
MRIFKAPILNTLLFYIFLVLGSHDCSKYTEYTQASKLGTFFFILKSYIYDLFMFANNSFSKIWSINSDADGFIS